MTFHVTFSLSTGRSAVHAPTCRAAGKPRRGHIVLPVQAATPQDAAQAWTESEELVFRGFPLPVICDCAISLSPSEV
jgi:hypothetical protein